MLETSLLLIDTWEVLHCQKIFTTTINITTSFLLMVSKRGLKIIKKYDTKEKRKSHLYFISLIKTIKFINYLKIER
jgi:hypothetical protein